ncbi:hypothetical protein CpB0099 [Chlamydia pneumoniae TW-183]|uniref:Uncharacterized protein n=2 Tax=Chlamydia pneumoniae TaxID=83558 RepID=A0A0F7XGR7_CHLPN|nr:hypothetical protein [Chlamydia pneumoniae]AAP98032.1 hypothetical protein CpB0099 [Chlamydia pneumoniae TW-183]CRI51249.1 Uncharacterized protein BN1224_UZG1_A_01040 [Chlamydia pneumoniae]
MCLIDCLGQGFEAAINTVCCCSDSSESKANVATVSAGLLALTAIVSFILIILICTGVLGASGMTFGMSNVAAVLVLVVTILLSMFLSGACFAAKREILR